MTKLWIYTNYDCNLTCSYCVARSGPRVPRRAVDQSFVERAVNEAVTLGFQEVLFTGGEPFLLDDIYAFLDYASRQMPTTVLTNGMFLRGRRLEKLQAVNGPNLTVQVSLDSVWPEVNDLYRGPGNWTGAVAGLRALIQAGIRVRLSTTQTPENQSGLEELCRFHRQLGIAEREHLIRPLARSGASNSGIELDRNRLLPELTLNHEGVFWHPLSTEPEMLVTRQIFPLSAALALLGKASAEAGPQKTFT